MQTWWSKSEISQTWRRRRRRSCQLRIPKLQISANPQQQQQQQKKKNKKTATSRRALLTSLISHRRIWRRPNTANKKKQKNRMQFPNCRTFSFANCCYSFVCFLMVFFVLGGRDFRFFVAQGNFLTSIQQQPITY